MIFNFMHIIRVGDQGDIGHDLDGHLYGISKADGVQRHMTCFKRIIYG